MNEKFECTMWSEAECNKNNFKFIRSPASGCICKQTTFKLKETNPFNMQSEFTALQDMIHDLMNLKQEFEQPKPFKLNKYIIKIVY